MELKKIMISSIAKAFESKGRKYIDELRERLEYDNINTVLIVKCDGNIYTVDMKEFATFVDRDEDSPGFPPPHAVKYWIEGYGLKEDRALRANYEVPEREIMLLISEIMETTIEEDYIDEDDE